MRALFPLAGSLTTKMSPGCNCDVAKPKIKRTAISNSSKKREPEIHPFFEKQKNQIMKTFLKKLNGPEAEPQQFTEHEFTDNNASNEPSSNLKWKLTLLITLAATLGAFLMTACDDDPEFCSNCSSPSPASPPAPAPDSTPAISIRSIYPTDGEPGSTVNIILENFTDSNVDNHVAFGSTFADIIYTRHGMITVRVPTDLPNGDYKITVRSHGQIATSPSEFKVTTVTK